jgi:hypothetical protein
MSVLLLIFYVLRFTFYSLLESEVEDVNLLQA